MTTAWPIYTNENLFFDKINRKSAIIWPSLQFYGINFLVKTVTLWWGMAWLPFQKVFLLFFTFLCFTQTIHVWSLFSTIFPLLKQCSESINGGGNGAQWSEVKNNVQSSKKGAFKVSNKIFNYPPESQASRG